MGGQSGEEWRIKGGGKKEKRVNRSGVGAVTVEVEPNEEKRELNDVKEQEMKVEEQEVVEPDEALLTN